MPEAYIVDAVRTPVGKRGGSLSQIHPADLGAITLNALMERTGVDPAAVEDVVMGCLDTIGPQAGDIARTAWLAAGLPETTPGVTIDRQCGSSQQAVHFAAQAVMSGTSDLIVAGGVQSMSMIPIGYALTAARPLGFDDPFSGSIGWRRRYGDQEISQFGSRGPSSLVRPFTGMISPSKRPSAVARMARSWDSTPKASMASREMSHCSAMRSAPRNWLISWSP